MSTVNEAAISDLAPIQRRIAEAETQSIAARWDFGCRLLKMRVGKQLPRGMREDLTRTFGVEGSEITRRMKLAEKFHNLEEVEAACKRCGGAWREVIRQELTETSQQSSSDWGKRASWRLDKIVHEADDFAKREALVNMLKAALDKLSVETAKLAA